MDLLSTTVLSLDGDWLIWIDPDNIGREEKWFTGPRHDARPTTVPRFIQDAFPEYHGIAWYWRSFQCPLNPHPSGRIVIKFHTVDYIADVWINDNYVGGHEGGETPFEFDITNHITQESQNRIAVRVLNPTNEMIDGVTLAEMPHLNRSIPYHNGNSFNIGGILESVELMICPQVRITDIYAKPDYETGIIHINTNLFNSFSSPLTCRMQFTAAPAVRGDNSDIHRFEQVLPAGQSVLETTIQVNEHRLWSLEDPFLYRVTGTAQVLSDSETCSIDEKSVRCGFRDFRVDKGFFKLNGKRIFLRSTHTINHCPGGGISSPTADRDLLLRDMIYAKTLGFNMVRFIAQAAHPYLLDICDEIGLMVYEESRAAWCLADSEHMGRRFDLSYRELISRDRNHPSLTIWGMLNETFNNPTYQHAKNSLPLVRELDNTRLVLLGSGRWDAEWKTGSISNPESSVWEHVWGEEGPDAGTSEWEPLAGGCMKGAGDIHIYPEVPHPATVDRYIRTIGENTKPVFLSEYGIGSTMNVIREWRKCQEAGLNLNAEDIVLLKKMSDCFVTDWNRLGYDGTYAFPEGMLRHSQALSSRWRAQGFSLIRSNSNICGFNLTGMLDHVMTGEGVWTYWREWKPGIVDVMSDGWAPLRWCLFIKPMHVYSGRSFEVEVVVASEDVLKPGDYPICLRISGTAGVIWEHKSVLNIPDTRSCEYAPLAWPVMCETITLNVPAGKYELNASMENAAPTAGCISFNVSEPANYPTVKTPVTVWGLDSNTINWLQSMGISCIDFDAHIQNNREIILVGNSAELADDSSGWVELAGKIARGSTAIFISPKAFLRKTEQPEPDPIGWLPLENKGKIVEFPDWLYHKETVGKLHPIFEGLPSKGILDWDYYGQVISHTILTEQETPEDTAAAAFAVGHSCGSKTCEGYTCGTMVCSYTFGSGKFILITLRILENLDINPSADHLLLNLLNYAASVTQGPAYELPCDFTEKLRKIGYIK